MRKQTKKERNNIIFKVISKYFPHDMTTEFNERPNIIILWMYLKAMYQIIWKILEKENKSSKITQSQLRSYVNKVRKNNTRQADFIVINEKIKEFIAKDDGKREYDPEISHLLFKALFSTSKDAEDLRQYISREANDAQYEDGRRFKEYIKVKFAEAIKENKKLTKKKFLQDNIKIFAEYAIKMFPEYVKKNFQTNNNPENEKNTENQSEVDNLAENEKFNERIIKWLKNMKK